MCRTVCATITKAQCSTFVTTLVLVPTKCLIVLHRCQRRWMERSISMSDLSVRSRRASLSWDRCVPLCLMLLVEWCGGLTTMPTWQPTHPSIVPSVRYLSAIYVKWMCRTKSRSHGSRLSGWRILSAIWFILITARCIPTFVLRSMNWNRTTSSSKRQWRRKQWHSTSKITTRLWLCSRSIALMQPIK